eukprot:3298208-Rhodomonas_salina.5
MEADLVGAGRIGVGSDRREVVGGFNQPFHYVRGLETRQLDTSVWRNPALNVERLHEHLSLIHISEPTRPRLI